MALLHYGPHVFEVTREVAKELERDLSPRSSEDNAPGSRDGVLGFRLADGEWIAITVGQGIPIAIVGG